MVSKKKILFVVNYLMGGGLEQVLIDTLLAVHLEYDVRVLSIYDVKSNYLAKAQCYAPIDMLDKWRGRLGFLDALYSRIFDMQCIQRVLFNSYIKKHSFNCVIAFAEGWTLKLIANSDLEEQKKVAWIHTDFIDESTMSSSERDYYSRLFQSFSRVVYVSQILQDKFQRLFSLKNGNTIYNSISLNKIKQLLKGDSYINRREGRMEFVCVGRLSKEKGFDRLIHAFSKLPFASRFKVHLTIVGGGGEYEYLSDLIIQNGLSNTITLVGMLDNPYPTICSADVLLAPSRYEGFGLSVLEALAVGTPVVATRTIGFTDVLDNGKYGILVENTDTAFDNILPQLLNDMSILDQYRGVMFERVNFFSFDKFKQVVLNFIETL